MKTILLFLLALPASATTTLRPQDFVASSTYTFNIPANASITNTTFGTCLTSTVAWVSSGSGLMHIGFFGHVDADGTRQMSLTVLEDGGYITRGSSNFSNAVPMWEATEFVAFFTMDVQKLIVLPAPASGSHNYCLAAKTSAGTMRWRPSVSQGGLFVGPWLF